MSRETADDRCVHTLPARLLAGLLLGTPFCVLSACAAPNAAEGGTPIVATAALPTVTPPSTETPDFRGLTMTPVIEELSRSGDGVWVARRATWPVTPTAESSAQDTQLRVERMDGSQTWIAANEVTGDAICSYPVDPFGFSGDDRFFYFDQYGCGEGCVRFAGPVDVWQLDLRTGDVSHTDWGSQAELAPDGNAVAWLDGSHVVYRNLTDGTDHQSNLPDTPHASFGGLLFSPDGKRLAVTELVGDCPNESETATIVYETADMKQLGRFQHDDSLLEPHTWLPDGRIDLETLPTYDESRTVESWLLDPDTGQFTQR